MSLCFAAVTPHPPLLLPSVGKDKIDHIGKTKQALETLEQELYVSKPQLILVLSAHGSLFHDAFSINAHTQFTATFEHFGDLITKFTWPGSPDFAAKISHAAKQTDLPIQLVSEERIDHGTSIPLSYLTAHLEGMKVLPIGYSGLDHTQHVAFGSLLKEVILETEKRVAVIASGDLSHIDVKESSLSTRHLPFDGTLQTFLEQKRTDEIISINEQAVAEANQCGYHSILILLGILRDMGYTFRTLSYECPFGVGYLVGQFMF